MNKNQTLMLIGIAFLLACAVGWFAMRALRVPTVPSPGSAATTRKSSRTVEMERLEGEAGLVRRPVRHDDKNVYFTVAVSIPSTCRAGDIDAIRMDLDHAKDKRLILTIEPVLPDPSLKPMHREVSALDLSSGFSHPFTLAHVTKPVRLGIYLCKDSSKQNSCARKEFHDLNRIFNTYLQSAVPIGYDAPDKTYFFQFLNLDEEDHVAAFGKAIPTQANFNRLGDYFRMQGAGETSDKTARNVQALTGAVASLPVSLRQTLQISLPAFDRVHCGSAKKVYKNK